MHAKSSTSALPPLGKFLASSEKPVRDRAVLALSAYLSNASVATPGEPEAELEVGDCNWEEKIKLDARLSELELSKLWQGIFYCFWMSDKPLVQQALAQTLANLVLDVRPKQSKKHPARRAGRVGRVRSALAFLKAFWSCIIREWTGLDILRLDKFYLLIRRFIGSSFKLLAREDWDLQVIQEYNEVLTGEGGPLCVTDTRIPHSIAYHIADIYIVELERSLPLPSADPTTPSERTVPLAALLQPFLTTLARAPSKPMFERIVDNIFTPLIEELLAPSSSPAVAATPTTGAGVWAKKRKVVVKTEEEKEYPRIALQSRLTILPVGEATGEDDEDADELQMPENAQGLGRNVLNSIFKEGGKSTTGEVNRRRLYTLFRTFNEMLL